MHAEECPTAAQLPAALASAFLSTPKGLLGVSTSPPELHAGVTVGGLSMASIILRGFQVQRHIQVAG
jgi:hypothetical protein